LFAYCVWINVSVCPELFTMSDTLTGYWFVP